MASSAFCIFPPSLCARCSLIRNWVKARSKWELPLLLQGAGLPPCPQHFTARSCVPAAAQRCRAPCPGLAHGWGWGRRGAVLQPWPQRPPAQACNPCECHWAPSCRRNPTARSVPWAAVAVPWPQSRSDGPAATAHQGHALGSRSRVQSPPKELADPAALAGRVWLTLRVQLRSNGGNERDCSPEGSSSKGGMC